MIHKVRELVIIEGNRDADNFESTNVWRGDWELFHFLGKQRKIGADIGSTMLTASFVEIMNDINAFIPFLTGIVLIIITLLQTVHKMRCGLRPISMRTQLFAGAELSKVIVTPSEDKM